MVEENVVILCPQEETREHHSVEGNIVLGHELVQLDLRGGGEEELINQGYMNTMCQDCHISVRKKKRDTILK